MGLTTLVVVLIVFLLVLICVPIINTELSIYVLVLDSPKDSLSEVNDQGYFS